MVVLKEAQQFSDSSFLAREGEDFVIVVPLAAEIGAADMYDARDVYCCTRESQELSSNLVFVNRTPEDAGSALKAECFDKAGDFGEKKHAGLEEVSWFIYYSTLATHLQPGFENSFSASQKDHYDYDVVIRALAMILFKSCFLYEIL